MKSFYALCSWTAVAAFFPLFFSCRKVAEVLKEDPDAIGKFCRIDTFSFGYPTSQFEQTMVSYNSAGDPEAILPKFFVLGEQFDDIYFRYDRYHRLRDMIFVVPGGTNTAAIDQWRRFSYPRPGLVIDSLLNYDGPGVPLGPSFTLPPDPPPYISAVVSAYEQDERGRTIRTWTEFPNPIGPPQPIDTTIIAYDRKGNQIRPGVRYDDKINIYRTNKVWQLIFQDYSTNNPVSYDTYTTFFSSSDIATYNRWGLPKLYEETEGMPGYITVFLYQFSLDPEIQVSYSCDGDSDPKSGSLSKTGGE